LAKLANKARDPVFVLPFCAYFIRFGLFHLTFTRQRLFDGRLIEDVPVRGDWQAVPVF
jgi:hypothetical protein